MVWSAVTFAERELVPRPPGAVHQPRPRGSRYRGDRKPWLAPWTTYTVPAGMMLPPTPAAATMVQRSMVKFAALESRPTLPAASRASTRTRAVPVGVLGTVQEQEPLFGMPVAIALGNVAPPSVE